MDLEFLNCINRRRDCETLIDFVANGYAIEQENVVFKARAVCIGRLAGECQGTAQSAFDLGHYPCG